MAKFYKNNRKTTQHFEKVRKDVKKRDGNRCQMPGCVYRGRKLQVHHIHRHADAPLLRDDPRNLILLCVWCHRKTQKKESYYIPLFTEIVLRNIREDREK